MSVSDVMILATMLEDGRWMVEADFLGRIVKIGESLPDELRNLASDIENQQRHDWRPYEALMGHKVCAKCQYVWNEQLASKPCVRRPKLRKMERVEQATHQPGG